jgi:hypothetical protein
LRTRRWRARRAAQMQEVTHQGSQPTPADAVLAAIALPSSSQPTQSCLSTVNTIATTRTVPSWRCHWCCEPCAAHVRLGFLRHSPNHGYSP